MAEVLVVGAFGQRNPGDEALCGAICRALSGHRVVVATRHPARTAREDGCVPVRSTGWSIARAIRRADAVVVGGGTIFKSLHPASGRRAGSLVVRTALMLAAAHLRRIPVAMVGVGAASIHSRMMRRIAGWAAVHADLLVLRDEESAAALSTAGAPPPFWIGADPAWTLIGRRPRHDATRATAIPQLTVALSHLVDIDGSHTPEMAEVLRRFTDRGWRVRLQPWQPGADVVMANRLRRLVPGSEVLELPPDLEAAAASVAEDHLVIAMRFHALVAAAASRRRMVAIAHEPKLAGLARRLGQVAVPPTATAEVIDESCLWMLNRQPPSDDDVAREVELAERTMTLLRVLLDGGHMEQPEELGELELSDGGGRW